MSKLAQGVVQEIERRGLKPRPAIYFVATRSLIWVLCASLVLLGAISVIFGVSVIADLSEQGGVTFGNMQFDDAAIMTPLLALILFLGFAASASMTFRLTKNGHIASRATVIGVALGLSLLLGFVLHVFDFGQSIDGWLHAR